MSERDFVGHRLMERRLEEELPGDAELFEALGGRELHLDEVLARAGDIRRRRRTTTGLVAAAAVLALVAPAGIVLAGRDDAGGPGPLTHPTAPASTAVTPTPSPDRSADPGTVHRIGIAALAGRPVGVLPTTGYVESGVWHDPAGGAWKVPYTAAAGVVDLARIGDRFLVATADDAGHRTALLVGRDPNALVHRWPMAGGFAVSAGGGVVAFARPDGTPVAVQDGGRSWRELPRTGGAAGSEVAAVVGEDCRGQAAGGGCTVFLDQRGVHPRAWVSTPHGAAGASAHLVSVADADGLVAGIAESHPDLTTCSAVRTAGDRLVWQTCAARFVAFSPDGSLLLATGPVGDGLGETELAVLDARSGDPVVRYRTARGAVITRMVWEDDAHVLAVVFDRGLWAVVRAGLDGRVEIAVPPVPGQDLDSPFVLPAR
jgi:hypothetical protein